MRINHKKVLLSLALLLLAGLAGSGDVDRYSSNYADQGLKRALLTFAVARGLNGVISVAQGTEVAVQPAGVGINFTPGQILDPVNDLVERFSWVMLASSVSLGLQKLLLGIFASDVFTIFLLIVVAVALITLWYRGARLAWLRPLAYRLALGLLLVRFAIPVAAMIGEGVFALFLQEPFSQSSQHLEQTTDEIAQVNRKAGVQSRTSADESLLERAQRLVGDAAASMDIQAYVDRYQAVAADASEHAVNLIVIFLLQTVLLPLSLLWLLVRALKSVIRLSPPT